MAPLSALSLSAVSVTRVVRSRLSSFRWIIRRYFARCRLFTHCSQLFSYLSHRPAILLFLSSRLLRLMLGILHVKLRVKCIFWWWFQLWMPSGSRETADVREAGLAGRDEPESSWPPWRGRCWLAWPFALQKQQVRVWIIGRGCQIPRLITTTTPPVLWPWCSILMSLIFYPSLYPDFFLNNFTISFHGWPHLFVSELLWFSWIVLANDILTAETQREAGVSGFALSHLCHHPDEIMLVLALIPWA